MCGIVGAFWQSEPTASETLLTDALQRLRLRGPNGSGVEVSRASCGTVAFGHARLSVIDLSRGGHQPMVSRDGRYAIVFNGEIYNYRELRQELMALGRKFDSASDTEVLLASWQQWGSGALPRLDGMFAFVVHDRERHTLVGARDAFGIKPFFYHAEHDRFCFASTQRALVALRGTAPSADHQRCYDYLVHGDYDSDDHSFVEGVRHLLPGHFVEIDLTCNVVAHPQRWRRQASPVSQPMRHADAVEAVRETFLTNIRLQLRSDVALGAALSGGIDSSAVVCAMRYVEPHAPISTFSYIAAGTALSEEKWVDLVNAKTDATAHKITVSVDDMMADLDDIIEAQEEPVGSTSIYAQYRVFKLAHEAGVTVTLDGQGADELLAGYTGYPGFRLLSLLERGNLAGAHDFARQWAQWPDRSYWRAVMELGRVVLPDNLYARARRHLGRDFRPAWLTPEFLDGGAVRLTEARPSRSAAWRGRRVVEQLSKSVEERGLPALLRHADRNSMRFSVESRVPFLTNGFADLALSLPEDYLISQGGETKSIFRAAMRGIVPDAILDRRDKIGFATPESQWLRSRSSQLRTMIAESVEAIPFIRRDALLAAFDVAIARPGPLNWQVWRWVNFARWYANSSIKV